jgi:hypothetical protein
MASSYGVGNPPEGALYGVYDSDNGEWTGHFFFDLPSAQAEADKLRNDDHFGVVSITDDEDWL